MTRVIFMLYFLVVATNGSAQNLTMHNYTMPNLGTISIPSNMVKASDSYNNDADEFASDAYPNGTKPQTITFKQKDSMRETYARVIVNTFIKTQGAYLKMNSWKLSSTELKQVNEQFRKANESANYRGQDRLITWNGTTVETINGCKALKTSYVRQVDNAPYVYVEMYTFFNNDRLHTLILSYRQKDEKLWKPLYTQILNGFKITNIK